MKEISRTARCGCGALTATVAGEPKLVYACACLRCQQKSGGAFTYSAVYLEGDVAVDGARTSWQHQGDSGRNIETNFCPTCGSMVFSRSDIFPGMVIIAVGCFSDPDFVPPQHVFWAKRHHRWLTFPDDAEIQDTQPV